MRLRTNHKTKDYNYLGATAFSPHSCRSVADARAARTRTHRAALIGSESPGPPRDHDDDERPPTIPSVVGGCGHGWRRRPDAARPEGAAQLQAAGRSVPGQGPHREAVPLRRRRAQRPRLSAGVGARSAQPTGAAAVAPGAAAAARASVGIRPRAAQ